MLTIELHDSLFPAIKISGFETDHEKLLENSGQSVLA
jgi:hypothetical protein